MDEAIPYTHSSQEKVALANELIALGINFFDQHESTKALNAFNSILKISENIAEAHHNIGFVYTEQLGMFDKAIPAFKKAISLKPDNAAAHFCYALALLSSGNLHQGFQEYLWRWKRGERSPRNFLHYPLEKQWNGQSLTGKTIALRAEQGFGDTLHFIRYAEVLHWMGATVIAEVQEPLIPLISLCPYIQKVVGVKNVLPPFDYQIPYLDIPAVVHTTLETIPSNVPYLFVHPERAHVWHQFFKDKKNTYNIGICWRGDAAHTDDKFMPIDFFAGIAHMHGVRLFSLQKHNTYTDTIPFSIFTFDESFDKNHGSFMDTAAVMKELDLVITADTSIAHLAGALGVPVWVILPFPAEWRWLTERKDSPWYATMRLFRQQKRNEWKDVAKALVQALQMQLAL